MRRSLTRLLTMTGSSCPATRTSARSSLASTGHVRRSCCSATGTSSLPTPKPISYSPRSWTRPPSWRPARSSASHPGTCELAASPSAPEKLRQQPLAACCSACSWTRQPASSGVAICARSTVCWPPGIGQYLAGRCHPHVCPDGTPRPRTVTITGCGSRRPDRRFGVPITAFAADRSVRVGQSCQPTQNDGGYRVKLGAASLRTGAGPALWLGRAS
jgi:hypothetical protein